MTNVSTLRVVAAALLATTSAASHAGAPPLLLLDDFAAPSAAQNALGPTRDYVVTTVGTFAGLPGQSRAAVYTLSGDPNGSGAVATIGGGSASAVDGAGAWGLYAIAYGSWASPQAPLDLDLSGYSDFTATFAHSAQPLNLNVVLHTARPLDPNNAVYYATAGLNIGPATPGGPVVAHIALDPAAHPGFDYAHVAGVYFEINAGGPFPDSSYALTGLQFDNVSAVPEPGPAVLLAAGLGVMAWRLRRRAAQA